MIIEGDLKIFLLQPRERKWLYFIHNPHNWAFFIIENSVISFFHIFHTVANQMTFKIECRTWVPPPPKQNWIKWSETVSRTAVERPIQRRIQFQTVPKTEQWKNKWLTISVEPQPETHWQVSVWRTPLRNKLSLDGNLLRSKRQTKTQPSEERTFAKATSPPPDRQFEAEQTNNYKHYEQCKR